MIIIMLVVMWLMWIRVFLDIFGLNLEYKFIVNSVEEVLKILVREFISVVKRLVIIIFWMFVGSIVVINSGKACWVFIVISLLLLLIIVLVMVFILLFMASVKVIMFGMMKMKIGNNLKKVVVIEFCCVFVRLVEFNICCMMYWFVY